MLKNKKFLFGVGVSNLNKNEILEEIKKWLKKKTGFLKIVTINPEILVLSQKNANFRKVLNKAQIATVDGIGIILAGKILGQDFKERVTGVGLMERMIKLANDFGLTVGLIGGKGNVALKTVECLKKRYKNLKIFGLEGAKDIKKITSAEKSLVTSIIADRKPQMLFVAFGAPYQEFFIDSLKKELQTRDYKLPAIVAIGVGGAFDEISGLVKRVPKWVDNLGLKWLWRLFCQPWRWRRQLALIEFIWLVLKEKLNWQKTSKWSSCPIGRRKR